MKQPIVYLLAQNPTQALVDAARILGGSATYQDVSTIRVFNVSGTSQLNNCEQLVHGHKLFQAASRPQAVRDLCLTDESVIVDSTRYGITLGTIIKQTYPNATVYFWQWAGNDKFTFPQIVI